MTKENKIKFNKQDIRFVYNNIGIPTNIFRKLEFFDDLNVKFIDDVYGLDTPEFSIIEISDDMEKGYKLFAEPGDEVIVIDRVRPKMFGTSVGAAEDIYGIWSLSDILQMFFKPIARSDDFVYRVDGDWIYINFQGEIYKLKIGKYMK